MFWTDNNTEITLSNSKLRTISFCMYKKYDIIQEIDLQFAITSNATYMYIYQICIICHENIKFNFCEYHTT